MRGCKCNCPGETPLVSCILSLFSMNGIYQKKKRLRLVILGENPGG